MVKKIKINKMEEEKKQKSHHQISTAEHTEIQVEGNNTKIMPLSAKNQSKRHREVPQNIPEIIEDPENFTELNPTKIAGSEDIGSGGGESLSFRVYFHFLRSAFVMMIFLGLVEVIPLCMRVSFNCQLYKDIHGDKPCPSGLRMIYSPIFFVVNDQKLKKARAEFYQDIFLKNWLLCRFCLLMMILSFIWAYIHQRIILRSYSERVKICDRSIMICNLWNKTTSAALINDLKGLGNGVEIDVISLTFANAGLGNMNRRRRIRAVEEIVGKLELDMEIYQGKKEKKIIKKLIKEYKKWLWVYKRDLKRFERYSKGVFNSHSAIAFATLGSKEQAETVIKEHKKRTQRCKYLNFLKPISRMFSTCCFCCCSCCFIDIRKPKILAGVHPDELNWNCLGYSRSLRRRSRRKLCLMRFLFTIIATYIIIISLILFKSFLYLEFEKNKNSLLSHVMSFAPTIIIAFMSKIGSRVLEKYERDQIYLEKSKYFRGKVWRLVWIQLIIYLLSLIIFGLILLDRAFYLGKKYLHVNFVYFFMKFPFVRSLIDPVSTIFDRQNLARIFKQRQASQKPPKKDSKVKNVNKYKFYPKTALDRIVEKPKALLELKYSRVLVILIMNMLIQDFIFPPFISIFFLILQFVVDKYFYANRYRDPHPRGVVLNRTMIYALQILPKLFILEQISNYSSWVKEPFSKSSWLFWVDFALVGLVFVPFQWIGDMVFRGFFNKSKKNRGDSTQQEAAWRARTWLNVTRDKNKPSKNSSCNLEEEVTADSMMEMITESVRGASQRDLQDPLICRQDDKINPRAEN